MPLIASHLQQFYSFRFIVRHCISQKVEPTKLILRIGKPLFCRLAVPLHALDRVLLNAITISITTTPYLYDGRALTMEEVLTVANPNDTHGETSKLSPEEIKDLAEYVLSL